MQWLIPYAFVDTPGCTQALETLALPGLEAVLRRLSLERSDPCPPQSLSPPHEMALARAAGIDAGDGRLPWAALARKRAGRDPGTASWAWVTPAHWQIGTGRIAMSDPDTMQLQDDESHALMQAMAPYFAQDGMALEFDTPGRWLVSGEPLDQLASASLDRVIGNDVGPWMPATPALRRLQNEMQMLLYTHPVNDARIARGLQPVNSFWISGSGALADNAPLAQPPRLLDDLRPAALRGDWAAWAQAWQRIDQQGCRELAAALDAGEPAQLVLCSDRSALHFAPGANGWRARLRRRFQRPTLKDFTRQL